MRIFVTVALLAISAGIGVWVLSLSTTETAAPTSTATELSEMREEPRQPPEFPPLQPDTRDFLKEKADQLAAAKSSADTATTDEQKLQILEQEAELLAMAEKYDVIRSDPTQREQHRAAMKEKLAQYSQNATPVILEQVQRQQSIE